MNQRISKKKSRPLFVGRTSNIGMMFWPAILERKVRILEGGIVRHSKKKDKIKKEVKELRYLIWEHETHRERRKEIERQLGIILNEQGEQAMLSQIEVIQEQVRKYWEKKVGEINVRNSNNY